MNWKLFCGLIVGIPAFALGLMWANAAKARMPYPSAIYFTPEMSRASCMLADVPDIFCPGAIPLPHRRPPILVYVRPPKPDPRKKQTAAK